MSERACGVVWTDEKETWHLKMGVVLVSEPAYPSFDDSFFVVFFGPFLDLSWPRIQIQFLSSPPRCCRASGELRQTMNGLSRRDEWCSDSWSNEVRFRYPLGGRYDGCGIGAPRS